MLTAKSMLKVNETTKSHWDNLNQATMDRLFENNNMRYIIKEQVALPFTDEYNEYEVLIDTISDDLVNVNKVYSDFIKIIFKDCKHKQNYKGQYYKINLDNEHEEYYICYDRINHLAQTATTKLVRCNNVLTWLDEYGNIIKMPCYLGTDITSTNNQISRSAIIPNSRMIVLIQANQYTMNIRDNQRFMFQHSNCFKVEEVNNYMQEQGTNGEVTYVKIYVNYSPSLPVDNKELNICNYYDNYYKLTIDQHEIEQVNGFNGHLNAIITNANGEATSDTYIWKSFNDSIVTIDEQGNYTITGHKGDSATVRCEMLENPNVYDEVKVTVVDDYLPEKVITVIPNEDTSIRQGKSKQFSCGVYINGEKQLDPIICIGSGTDQKCYTIKENIDGYEIFNNKLSQQPLLLTFKADGCEDVTIKVNLKGAI